MGTSVARLLIVAAAATTAIAGATAVASAAPKARGDEVVIAFERGEIRSPYVVGALWGGNEAPPETR